MIDWLKRWWGTVAAGRGANVTAGEDTSMSEENEQNERNALDMKATQELLKESRAKSREASMRLDDYQRRVQREYEKRIAIASGGRKRDE